MMIKCVVVTAIVVTASCSFVAGAVAAGTSAADCAVAWSGADTNKDGTITDAEADRYFGQLNSSQLPVAGQVMTKDQFYQICHPERVGLNAPNPGAPFRGENKISESQARKLVEDNGFAAVSTLSLDTAGVWRGTATRGGEQHKIAVDLRGNVVATR